ESAPAEGMAPYQSFRRNPRTESADREAATPLFAVMQKRKHVVVAEAIPPPEEVEFDGEAEARNLAPELLDELDACFHRAARGEQVIHQDHPLARLDRVLMNLEGVRPVFEVIGYPRRRSRQLARLPYGHKPRVEPVRERWTKDEATRFDAEHQVDVLVDVVLRERINERRESLRILEQGRDVVEEDTRLGKIGNGANERLQRLAVGGHRCNHLPGSFNTKRPEAGGFAVIQFVLDDGVHATAARSFAQGSGQIGQGVGLARSQYLHVPILGVAHPAVQLQRGRFAVNKPTESNALHAPFDQVVADHGSSLSVSD